MRGHWSDCAIYNEPESVAAPCNCGGLDLSVDGAHPSVVPGIAGTGALGLFLRQMHSEGLIQDHHLPANWFAADAAAANLPDTHARIACRRNADSVYLNDALKTVILETETRSGGNRRNR